MSKARNCEPYVRNIVLLLRQLAEESVIERNREPEESTGWYFQDGQALALLSALDTMKAQSDAYGLDARSIGLGDFVFEREVERLSITRERRPRR